MSLNYLCGNFLSSFKILLCWDLNLTRRDISAITIYLEYLESEFMFKSKALLPVITLAFGYSLKLRTKEGLLISAETCDTIDIFMWVVFEP